MADAFWVVYWAVSVLCAVLRLGPVFLAQLCTFLILMRTTNNQMSQNCWYGLWFSLAQLIPSLHVPLDDTVDPTWWYWISIIIRLCISSDYLMPTAVFWVLFVCLASRYKTVGSFIWYHVLIFNLYIDHQGIHLPGLLISHYVTASLVFATIIIRNLILYPGYIPALLLWFVSVGVFYKHMWPWNEDFGWLWIGAWLINLQAIFFCFSPSMPYPWYPVWAVLVVGLGFLFHPKQSLGAFTLWSITLLVLRMVVYIIYVVYFLCKGLRWRLFPFSYFSRVWRVSSESWFPINSRRPDGLNDKFLCERCAFVNESKLIMGSTSYLSRLVEWYDFSTREEFFARFASSGQPSDNAPASPTLSPPCGLCRLLWHSMSPARRKALIPSVEHQGPPYQPSSIFSRPENPEDKLRVQVWEERPLSLYTYMQLYWGDVAIGARLLVHRGELFATTSPAVKCDRTDSPEHFDQAKKWLSNCRGSHKLCQGVGNANYEPPARMLYVRGGSDWRPGNTPEALKLVNTSDMDAESLKQYLALSHCWGPTAEMRLKLLASNIDACYNGIDFTDLSQNMKDAITTTIELGFSYIWIDSLCIIQRDDKGEEKGEIAEAWKEDWQTEAKKMGAVYSGAVCTIASTGSATSTGGCFHARDTAALQPCKIGVSSPDTLTPLWIYARRDDVFDFTRGVDLAPLNTRGWVMQERLLSRRILHFGADMLYWECCGRSASELNPQGYTYKRFPEDFSDNYMPHLDIETRRDLREAELEGRGFSWAFDEELRRRPPPVMIDPDAPPGGQAVWQRKRGFWKNVLKPTEASWADDEGGGGSSSTGRARAGFRAAFEQLRGDLDTAQTQKMVGRHSFSQLWYDVIEAYSRGRLTSTGDKLMALRGIEQEVARVTKFTYLCGLWRERLATDLLWFAIEGPGRRLVKNGSGAPVAPTWSWASIEGVVALDLLPQNTTREIGKTEMLVTIYGANRASDDDPAAMTIDLAAPLLDIEAEDLAFDGSIWHLDIGKTGKPSARVFPDVVTPNICEMSGLVCVCFIVLERDKVGALIPSSSEDSQGLVLRRLDPGTDAAADAVEVYERVGYFTTSYIEKSKAARKGRKALKTAEKKSILLAG